jgi:hypothetical protein
LNLEVFNNSGDPNLLYSALVLEQATFGYFLDQLEIKFELVKHKILRLIDLWSSGV